MRKAKDETTKILIQLPVGLKKYLDDIALEGYTASGYIRGLIARDRQARLANGWEPGLQEQRDKRAMSRAMERQDRNLERVIQKKDRHWDRAMNRKATSFERTMNQRSQAEEGRKQKKGR